MIQTNSQDFDSQNHNTEQNVKLKREETLLLQTLWSEPNIRFSFPKNPYEWYKDLNPQIFCEQT